MSSNQPNRKLEEYQLANEPTTIKEVEKNPDQSVVEEFDQIEGYCSSLEINDSNEYLVGRKNRDSPPRQTQYPIFHHPQSESGDGFAGMLIRWSESSLEDKGETKIGFKTSEEATEEDNPIKPVENLCVKPHNRGEHLDEKLVEIRTELTGVDWSEDGIIHTRYEDQLQASNKLADFIQDMEEGIAEFPPKVVMLPRVMDAIGQYPLDAVDIMYQTELAISRNLSNGLHDASPEELRTILIEFYNYIDED